LAISGGTTFKVDDVLEINSVISGSGGLTKTGTGFLSLGEANTYSGGTTLTEGGLTLLKPNSIGSSEAEEFTFKGGVLYLADDFSTFIGPLSLEASSSIDMVGVSNGSVNFLSAGRTGGTLTINNWTGSPFTSGTGGKLFVSPGQASSDFLANVNFSGYGSGAYQLGTGEIVPVPEPSTVIAACLLFGAIGWNERKRLLQWLQAARRKVA